MDAEPLPELRAGAPPGYTGMTFLARGGSATAYRSVRDADGLDVVVKVVDAAGRSTDREIASARALEGVEGINPVLDHGLLDDGRPFLVTPHRRGGSLAPVVDGRPMTAEQVAELGVRVGDALARAHRRGVIHGDVKPSNVLVGDDGPLLADFGAARSVSGADATQQETVAVTVVYAAPEVLEGATPDARSDQYSLGVTLLALLLGRPPFGTGPGGMVALLDDICRGHLPAAPAGTPEWLDTSLRRACATDPADRFATTDDLVAALRARRAQDDRPRPPRRRRSGPPVVLAGIAAALALVVVGALSLWAFRSDDGPTTGAATPDGGATGATTSVPGVPPPARPSAPDLVRTASARFTLDPAVPVPSGGDGYLEVATYVPAEKFSLCLPDGLAALYRFGPELCAVQFRGDAHGRIHPAALDPSQSRLYVRVDFRDGTVTASAHSGCSNRSVDSPATCTPTTPVVETDGAYSDRFRAKWRWCDEPPLQMTTPLAPDNAEACLRVVGQWFDRSQAATPYVHFFVRRTADRGSEPPFYRLNGDMPSDAGTTDLPRMLQDYEIDLRNDGTVRIRRDCFPAMEVHWVDQAGRRLLYDGGAEPRTAGLPVEFEAAKDKECEATVRWGP